MMLYFMFIMFVLMGAVPAFYYPFHWDDFCDEKII